MKYLKKLLKSFLYGVSSIIILTFIITLFNYFDIINGKLLSILKIIIPLFSLSLSGYMIGKNANKNGWLEGLKIGLIITLLIMIYNLIFDTLTLKDIIFYLALIISAIVGSILGINKKEA